MGVLYVLWTPLNMSGSCPFRAATKKVLESRKVCRPSFDYSAKKTILVVSYLVPAKILPFAAPSVVRATRSGMTTRPAFPSTTCPNG